MNHAHNPSQNKLLSAYIGSLLGLAAGDALGAAVEFKDPGTFEPVRTMRGGGAFRLKPGEWTDDTSMTLCLAESLIENDGFNPDDQMQRYVRWYQHGYLSSTGKCFDIGMTTLNSLKSYMETKEPYPGLANPKGAGNGSLMRVAPIALAYMRAPKDALRFARLSSETTHGGVEAGDACRFFVGLIVGALEGKSKQELLAPDYEPFSRAFVQQPLSARIAAIAQGSYKVKNPPDIQGRGYVVPSLEAALWAFYRSDSFEEATLKAVNLGHDADTTGAIVGQLAGAFFGVSAIPEARRKQIAQSDMITQTATKLYDKFYANKGNKGHSNTDT